MLAAIGLSLTGMGGGGHARLRHAKRDRTVRAAPADQARSRACARRGRGALARLSAAPVRTRLSLISHAPQGPANVDAICALVEAGAGAAALAEHEALETPLHIAARCGRADALQRLLACRMPATARTKARPRRGRPAEQGAWGRECLPAPVARHARYSAPVPHVR